MGRRGESQKMHIDKPTGTNRRRLSPEDRRSQIIDGSVAYFAEVGLSGNTRELSRRLGVTQSLIFKYFPTKADLHEAVYEHLFLTRLAPRWPVLIRDRSLPLKTRITSFYLEYTDAIFTYEWMRVFIYSGLDGAQLNRRYLKHLSEWILNPLLDELVASSGGKRAPNIEDVWNLHGGIIYIGIRRFIYQTPTPEDDGPAIRNAIKRFLSHWDLDGDA
jgi:AcrR family transcriptional regulator